MIDLSSGLTAQQLEAIREIIIRCGEIMLKAHDIESADNIEIKPGDANFVTVYDKKVQNELISGLKNAVPDAVFFAEEKDNSSVDTENGFCFIIDPIDGTTNFIHDMCASAISVGLLSDGKPYFGAIYDPYRREYFSAVAGCGAYKNGKKVSVSSRPLEKSLFSFGSSPYNKSQLADISFEKAKAIYKKTADIRRSGSAAIDLINVACGKLDAFFEFILSPWDYAAGAVIVSEAGGKITSFDGGGLTFDKPSSMLCSNGIVHEEIRKILCE